MIPILCLAVGSMASCEERKPTEAPPPMIDRSIPAGKPRADAAAANTKPSLEKDLVEKKLRFGDPIFIRAFKKEGEVELFVLNRESGKYDLFRTYQVAGQSGTLGPKLAEGDGQVPEGFYFVPPSAMNPSSQFHLSFNIGYPNAYDQSLGRTGSAIMIHGSDVSIGCLAMTDEKVEEIYTLAAAAHGNGQAFFRVHIFPFRMTAEQLVAKAGDPNLPFWENLKEGYDFFEKHRVPPDVSVGTGRYRFAEPK